MNFGCAITSSPGESEFHRDHLVAFKRRTFEGHQNQQFLRALAGDPFLRLKYLSTFLHMTVSASLIPFHYEIPEHIYKWATQAYTRPTPRTEIKLENCGPISAYESRPPVFCLSLYSQHCNCTKPKQLQKEKLSKRVAVVPMPDKMLTGKRKTRHLDITWVNRAVFCPVITFSACPCVDGAPTPTLPWTTEAGVSCLPELWGEGWPTRKVPCSRSKL